MGLSVRMSSPGFKSRVAIMYRPISKFEVHAYDIKVNKFYEGLEMRFYGVYFKFIDIDHLYQ